MKYCQVQVRWELCFCWQSAAMETGWVWLEHRLGSEFSQHSISAEGKVWLDTGRSFICRSYCSACHGIDAYLWNARYVASCTLFNTYLHGSI